MFKSVVFALALSAVGVHAMWAEAEDGTSLDGDFCANDQDEMSVQGVDGYFCVDGSGCAGTNSTGLCPEAQVGLDFGSYCDLIETGVYGCKPYLDALHAPSTKTYDYPRDCTGNIAGEHPVSVEDVDGSFCSAGPVCSGKVAGNCPGAQDGLPYGSVCVVIKTGVYGCVLPQ